MRNRKLLIPLFIVLLIVCILFAYTIYAINMGTYYGREPVQRYYCWYDIRVTDLSGKEVTGTTTIMLPIPASKEGEFFTPEAQKEPTLFQSFLFKVTHRYRPEEDHKIGPYFRNMTETVDNKELAGNWITFITKTDKGYLLGFRTNKTKLEDIHFGVSFVADYIDVLDPVNKGSPILFPVENVSNISSVPYGDYTKYASSPTYDSYVYLSNNLKGNENVSFFVYLNANNDPTKWSQEYRGRYTNLLATKVNETGYVKVKVIVGQEMPFGNKTLDVLSSQYARDFYDNKTAQIVSKTSVFQEVV